MGSTNKARVEKLIAAGLMTEAGLKMIEVAKQTGTWGAFDAVDAMIVPDDFKRALKADPGCEERLRRLHARRQEAVPVLHFNDAKRPETRAKRIAQMSIGCVVPART